MKYLIKLLLCIFLCIVPTQKLYAQAIPELHGIFGIPYLPVPFCNSFRLDYNTEYGSGYYIKEEKNGLAQHCKNFFINN